MPGRPRLVQGGTSISDVVSGSATSVIVRSLDNETFTAEGKYSDRFIINKFGRNPSLSSGALPSDIWDLSGVYTGFPISGSAEVIRATSDSANDASAGTGARTILILGLDSSYNLINETVTLNGTTPVVTTKTL